MTLLTLETTGKTLFGSDVGNRAHAMTRSLSRALGAISRLGPILKALPPWASDVHRAIPLPWHAASYLLANDPRGRARVRARRSGRARSRSHLRRSVAYPAASAFGRRVVEPCEHGGYAIEPGTGIVIGSWVMHRNPRWFAEPERFSLARWSAPGWPEFAFVPFGGGARRCIRDVYARVDMRPIRTASASLRPSRPVRLRVAQRA